MIEPIKEAKQRIFGYDIDDKKLVYTLLFIVFTVWILFWGLEILTSIFSEREIISSSSFDAFNSLFSGLAFAGIIYTLLLQREGLRLTREDLRLTRLDLGLTRDEIRGQKLEMQQQNETLLLQRFENTFFNLLSNHKELLSNFSIRIYPEINLKIAKNKGKPINVDAKVGRHYLRKYYNSLKLGLSKDEKKSGDHINKYNLCESVFPEMTLYFNSIRTILQYIDETTLISKSEKRFYFDILKSQLIYLEENIILYKLIYAEEKPNNLKLRQLVLQHFILTIGELRPFHNSHYSYIQELVKEQSDYYAQEKESAKPI